MNKLFFAFLSVFIFSSLYAQEVDFEFQNSDLQRVLKIENKIEEAKKSEDKASLETLQKQSDEAIEILLDDLSEGNIKLINLIESKKELLNLERIRGEIEDKSSLEYETLSLKIASIDMTRSLVSFALETKEMIDGFEDSRELQTLLLDFEESITISLEPYRDRFKALSLKEDRSALENEFLLLYDECRSKKLAYSAISSYAKTQIVKLQESNRFIDIFNIKSLILYIDTKDSIKSYSKTLKLSLGVTIGQVVASLFVFLFIVAFKNIITPTVINIAERVFSRQSKEERKNAPKSRFSVFLRNSLHRPIGFLVYIFAVDMGVKVLVINEIPDEINHFFDALYAFIIIWMLFSLLNNAVFHYSNTFLKKYPNIRGEMVNFIVNVLKFFIIATVLVVLLHSMGLNVTGLVASLGIGGLAVALAAKDTLSNIFGSISIIMDNMFSQGDWIATDKGEGTVIDIGMRTTKIRTFDNAMIFLPNSYLANTDIKNWNKRKVGRRIMMHIGVTYGSKMEDVIKAVEDIKEMLINHKDIANPKNNYEIGNTVFDRILIKEDQLGIKNTLLVYLDRYSSSSIDILIYCFSKTVNWADWLDVKQDVLVKISEILKANNLEFAFPSQSVYLKNEGGKPFEITDARPTS